MADTKFTRTAVENVIELAERMGLRPRPLASQPVFRLAEPSLADVWADVKAQTQIAGETFCACEGYYDRIVGGVIHADDCPIERMDRLVERRV